MSHIDEIPTDAPGESATDFERKLYVRKQDYISPGAPAPN